VHAFSKALSAVKAAVLFPVQNLASTWAALQALDAQTAREDLDAQIQLIEQNARVWDEEKLREEFNKATKLQAELDKARTKAAAADARAEAIRLKRVA
jgi:hypothetical protein